MAHEAWEAVQDLIASKPEYESMKLVKDITPDKTAVHLPFATECGEDSVFKESCFDCC